MLHQRLLERTPKARFLETVFLDGYKLCFHKRGDDGTGKCDAFYTGKPEDRIYGVLFEMSAADKEVLDRIEGDGYEPVDVQVMGTSEVQAFTYVVKPAFIQPDLAPFKWYRDFVLVGAMQNQLPPHYIQGIGDWPVQDDPDKQRKKENQALLPEL